MTDTGWLTPAEVEELTARKRWKAQCVMLAQMGVPFRPNAVGRPLVERAAVDARDRTRLPHHFEGIGPKHALGLVAECREPEVLPKPTPRELRAWKRECAELSAAKKAAVKRLHEARRVQARPPWADLGAIAEIYATAKRVSKTTGIPHEVDHIVPLLGKSVSGLHWEGNLRVVRRTVNRRKGNRLDQEQPSSPDDCQHHEPV
jgi:hypothetical protein